MPKVRRTQRRSGLEDEERRREGLEAQRELNSRQMDSKKAHNLNY